MSHVLMENRNGLAVDTRLTKATGTAKREAAKSMVQEVPGSERFTLGADKGYDTSDFARHLREPTVTPYVAQLQKGSPIDGRPTRIMDMRKPKYIGQERIDWLFTPTVAFTTTTWPACEISG